MGKYSVQGSGFKACIELIPTSSSPFQPETGYKALRPLPWQHRGAHTLFASLHLLLLRGRAGGNLEREKSAASCSQPRSIKPVQEHSMIPTSSSPFQPETGYKALRPLPWQHRGAHTLFASLHLLPYPLTPIVACDLAASRSYIFGEISSHNRALPIAEA